MIGCGFSSLQIFVRMLNFSDPLSSRACSNYQEHMKNLQMKVRGKQETIQKNLNNMSQIFAYFQVMARLMKQNRKTWKEYDFGKTDVSFSKNFFRVFGVFLKYCWKIFYQNHACSFPFPFIFWFYRTFLMVYVRVVLVDLQKTCHIYPCQLQFNWKYTKFHQLHDQYLVC